MDKEFIFPDTTSAQQLTRKVPSVVFMEKLSSEEHYLDIGCEPKQILQNISIDIKKGDIWAITGNDKYELKLLTEIMANIKPYYNGKCLLLERGMYKNKRIIHPDVFYYASTNMAYANMKVLEFLMFTTANSSFDTGSQQERLSDQLFSFGLGGILATPIYKLSAEYKAIILLLAGYFSLNKLIIINLPTLEYNDEQLNILVKIAEKIRSVEQTLIFSTMDTSLIGKVCDHTAFLYDGKLIFNGTVEEFKNKYDRVIMTVTDPEAEKIRKMLSEDLTEYEYRVEGDILYISNNVSGYGLTKEIYEKIITAGFIPSNVRVNRKTVKNAYKEILTQNEV